MWVKVDDGMWAHRKTRAVTKSHEEKRRDAAPMGLWVLAASWAGDRGSEGWVPEDELDRWDDDWPTLVLRLIDAGYWWSQSREGEAGFGFTDWHDYNDPADAASKAGTFGNHIKWHAQRGLVNPECEHCPKEPDEPEDRGEIGGRSGGDSQPESGGESQLASGAIALPEPDPNPNPNPNPELPRASARAKQTPERFEEFWDTYSHKVGRKKAESAYRAALKKPGVTADLLITAAAAYIAWQISEGKHPAFTKHPASWLNGEHWTDERVARAPQLGRVGQHMALVRQLAEQEQPTAYPQIGPSA